MDFTSIIFLFLFLPLTLLGYYLIRKELKILLIVITSLLFYSINDPKSLWLLVFSIIINYLIGYGIGYVIGIIRDCEGQAQKSKLNTISKILLTIGIAFNLVLLFYYKYYAFSLKTMNSLFGFDFVLPMIGLPLGISFFTFRSLSYLIDIYWNRIVAQNNLMYAALYISFFPQVTMGPIVQYNNFISQINDFKFNFSLFSDGVKQIIIGLLKKVVVADGLGTMVDYIFSMEHQERTVVLAWLGIAGYLIQLYYDFGGYSDISIGLGKLFGFETPSNFDYPYASKSITEFWRRWHITLGNWFRDYVFIPVSRSKLLRRICKWTQKHFGNIVRDNVRTIVPFAIVWLLTGLWHGAAWHYIAWGVYQYIFIMIERIRNQHNKKIKIAAKMNKERIYFHEIRQHVYFLGVLIFGQIMFRIDGFWNYFPYVKSMFGLLGNSIVDTSTKYYWRENASLLIGGGGYFASQ